jgi:hypothetical protein
MEVMQMKSRDELIRTLSDGASNILREHCNDAVDLVGLRKNSQAPLYAKVELFKQKAGEEALKYDEVMHSHHAESARTSLEDTFKPYKYVDGNPFFRKILNPGAKQVHCNEGDVQSFLQKWKADYSCSVPEVTFESIVVVPIKGPRWVQPDRRIVPPDFKILPLGTDKSLVGFMSIDSMDRDAFDEVDVDYMKYVGHLVFDVVRDFCTAYSALQLIPANSNPRSGTYDI